MTDFVEMARATLDLSGVPTDEADFEVLGMIAQAFDPAMRALDGAALELLPLEPDLDPGRPPRLPQGDPRLPQGEPRQGDPRPGDETG